MRLVIAIVLSVVLFSPPADAAIIDLGVLFGQTLQPYVNGAIDGAIFLALAWGGWYLKKKWGIDVDEKYRTAINDWAQRMAADLVAKGAVKVEGLKIEVKNEAVARLANTAIVAVPAAMNHFGLTPEKLEERIKSFVPTVPAVAAEVQSTTTPVAPVGPADPA